MSSTVSQLPVETILPELNAALASSGTAVLQAPPGSGKTTRVPLALLESPWLAGQRILMLEPRRIAASNAARYMATLRNESVGDSVGFSIRYQRRVGPATRLEVVTEGLLTRRLQTDPELAGVGLVIFDEFHERSLQADLALALCRDVQKGLREDLRLLIMSATLDAEPLSRLLDDCPIITAAGRSFPVKVDYLGYGGTQNIAEATARGIRHALRVTAGDLLAFLPGAGEISRCHELLRDLSSAVSLLPLHGSMAFADQEAALLPGARRRVVLATNVAETSLTIEGIETVVDSGWERRPRFDAARGMSRLERVRISRASAEQRTGRAGRLGPGYCFRLWSEGEQGALLPFAPPEIRQADLAPLAFELVQWGVANVTDLTWLDPPSDGHLEAARGLLRLLGAMDEKTGLTLLGRRMASYPAHPRLARLLVASVDADCPGLGSDLVALLSERDLLSRPSRSVGSVGASDLLERLTLLQHDRTPRSAQARRAAAYWRKRTNAGKESLPSPELVGRLLATAFPDRIAQRRSTAEPHFLLRSGQGALLSPGSVVRSADWLVAVELAGRARGDGEICLASRLSRTIVEELFGTDLAWQREAGWDETVDRVTAREVRRLGAIVLQTRPTTVRAEDSVPALLALVRRRGLAILPWTRETRQFQARASLLHRHLPDQDWPDLSDTALLREMETWLPAWLRGVKSRRELDQIDLLAALKDQVGWSRLADLDRLAPERLEVPSGSRIRVDYCRGEEPVLAVKLQEMFGLEDSPQLVDGRMPVLLHLLSPAGRPLAVTCDLKNFWDMVYPEVRKEMKGRYPKHPWPDDPWKAPATRHTKRTLTRQKRSSR